MLVLQPTYGDSAGVHPRFIENKVQDRERLTQWSFLNSGRRLYDSGETWESWRHYWSMRGIERPQRTI